MKSMRKLIALLTALLLIASLPIGAAADERKVTSDEFKLPEITRRPAEDAPGSTDAPAEDSAVPEASPAPEASPEPETSLEPEISPEPDVPSEPETSPEPETSLEPEASPEPDAPDVSEGGEPEETVETATLPADVLVRVAPGGEADGFLPAGTRVKVLEKADGWLHIAASGCEGYVLASEVYGAAEPETSPEPETTPEPELSPEPETTPEPPVQPEETLPETQDGPSVTVFISRGARLAPGETVSLHSLLEGFDENAELRLQWQCDKGGGFEDIPGATEASYEFEASAESLRWAWRLQVYVQ